MNILQALDDPRLFRPLLRDPATYSTWRVFLAALFGLGLDPQGFDLFRECTGRTTPPDKPFHEAWLICGRRGGKSFMMACIATYLACLRDYTRYLGPGERATVMVIAADRKQARVVMRYVRGLLQLPVLAPLVASETREAFDLTNRVTIEVGTASHRTIRGYSIAAALCDEIAFWPTNEDGAVTDVEILDALRPAMGNIPGALLICASSPYAQRGAMYEAFKRYFGRDDADVLIWKAATRVMNPSFPQKIINAAMERDAASASAEYMAAFRADIEGFITREALMACVEDGVYERGPLRATRYFGFVDPSGGVKDSMTLAVSHREGDMMVLDALREVRPPFSPDAVVQEFAAFLKSYRITSVRGDRYAGEWPREAFRKAGITYQVSDAPRSDIYVNTLPLINSRRVSLLDHDRMIGQFVTLERKTARSGKDSIDHAPGAHDDIANSVAGALLAAFEKRGSFQISDNLLAMTARKPGLTELWRP
ncbi:hypothetical protein AMST5_02155 [freshwater sediment metagenome]|uniref:Terminase n=1 Tax=freshwater sediment metagenome TaxID=556182 RepID=A0AA48RDE5_9ZZZZ